MRHGIFLDEFEELGMLDGEHHANELVKLVTGGLDAFLTCSEIWHLTANTFGVNKNGQLLFEYRRREKGRKDPYRRWTPTFPGFKTAAKSHTWSLGHYGWLARVNIRETYPPMDI
ncbi:uncharacterized protein PHALS_10310 [Plasmopara halstedii]|uniref:Uncharacterized protein n=1 Tax=Plasmopara halstedii TaxID=4781 RepID=A0A0N7L500_PLAHL|nr:uncharacterized protein PHALS_10310 [Plasmopara halstedii]CEG40091.1 hypothetical protein PHALS_10310 [Plasmopara halstedii]|eukprot:XP_024576460.1 hypothetical protein PHALS_10310 [Plasmopara halstedii]